MKAFALVDNDERAVAVGNASYRYAWNMLAFGLLLDISYRACTGQGSSWDLQALTISSALVGFAYQLHHKIFHRQWLRRMGLLMCLVIPLQILVAWLVIRFGFIGKG